MLALHVYYLIRNKHKVRPRLMGTSFILLVCGYKPNQVITISSEEGLNTCGSISFKTTNVNLMVALE